MSGRAPIHVLGINVYHADAAAVLLRDGEVVAAVAEERIRREKHWAGFPGEAVRRCLEIAGISGAEVDHVALGRDPRAHLLRKTGFCLLRRPRLSAVADRVRHGRRVRDVTGPLVEALDLDRPHLPPRHRVEHHPAHLASAFFCSPFAEAAVCAVDGFGDFVSTSTALGRGRRLDVLDRVHFPHSLGILYLAVTQHLGFPAYGDEYKVMGLAAYGEPTLVPRVRRLVRLRRRGDFRLRLEWFRHWSDGVEMRWEDGAPEFGPLFLPDIEGLLGPARRPEEPLGDRHRDLAASLQRVFEETLFHVLRELAARTGQRRLCLAGGCALNGVANGKLSEETAFDETWIPPAAGDDGTALGAALHVWHAVLGRPRRFVMEHAYWGPEYGPARVRAALARRNGALDGCSVAHAGSEEEACRWAARQLAEGRVLGWCRGRMEWGARALGNRSILADPRREEMRGRLNARVKLREPFRPFAPSVLEEEADAWFEAPGRDPFMVRVRPVRRALRDRIPAVTHVDGSARLHTVSKRENPAFHRLLTEFSALTGVPILLNTSLNENEPIVDTPDQALDCFLRTGMDALVLGDLLVSRVAESSSASRREAPACVA